VQLLRQLRRPAREIGRALLDLILPPACAACGADGDPLCGICLAQLGRRTLPGCRRCGEPVLVAGERCGSDHRNVANLARAVAPFHYAGTGGALVRRFKLDADAAAGRLLASAMAGAWRSGVVDGGWNRALLVPVPLHWRRRRRRGFDQAAWLARQLGRRLRLAVAPDLLKRNRATLPQGDPRVLSRDGNVAGVFAVTRCRQVAGRRVVLVDDVFTSGATARACAVLLRAAGAAEVAVLTACRS